MPGGRPSDYTDHKGLIICSRLADGESLRSICRDEGMPDKVTVLRWLSSNESFRIQYAKARELQAEAYADEIKDIADDSSNDYMEREGAASLNPEAINRSRLRIDARKWIASKLLPKKYGDRATYEHTGKDGGPIETMEITDAERARALAVFIARTKVETK